VSELQQLPSVESLLQAWPADDATPQDLRLAWIRDSLDAARTEIRDQSASGGLPAHGRDGWRALLLSRLAGRRGHTAQIALRRVINATGILLHTNLGRAPLGAETQQAIFQAISGYSTLEFDPTDGKRLSRLASVREQLARVTGAEDGLPVHNNAAAVYLALTALAAGREVLVSRGHLVEIGGGFRLPDIMAASGAKLIEVGTTNRTRVEDYARALTPQTALILKVHPSNFRMVGFTEEASTHELAALADARGLPLLDDLGSGALTQHGELTFGEPRVQDSIAAGAHLVAVSGDKLLGGPQAGLLVGRRTVIDRLAKHPFARVVRMEKASLAALEATLQAYLDPPSLRRRIPLLGLLERSPEELRARAEALAASLVSALGTSAIRVGVVGTVAEVGGGSLPGVELPSWAVSLEVSSADAFARALRLGDPAVVARISDDRVLLDLRSLLEGEGAQVVAAVRAASLETRGPGRSS